jgi:hypothetical protein
MPESLRNRLGRFLPRQALDAEAAEGIEAATVEDLLEDDFVLPVLPQTHADLRAEIAALSEQRAELLVTGDLDAIAVVDREVARLEVAGESLIARSQAAAAAHGRARACPAHRSLAPGTAASGSCRARNEAALRLCEAIDTCAAIEAEASGVANIVGIALGDFTPTEAMTRYLLENWARAGHARRLGQASRAA